MKSDKNRNYLTPEFSIVKIDHEISLIMLSPPVDPNKGPSNPSTDKNKDTPFNSPFEN